MGCSFSGLSAFYDSANAGADVWINENRFRIVRQIGEGGFAFVFLVKEVVAEGASGLAGKKSSNPAHISDHGTYAMKKVIIQTQEQLELVKQEIRVSSQFSHPNLLPLLDHAIIPTKDKQGGSQKHEAYLLFPVHLDGTLLDIVTVMQSKKEFFPTLIVLQIFRQIRRGKLKVGDDIALVVGVRKRQENNWVLPSMTFQSGNNDGSFKLCAGLKHMHSFDPPYAHNDVKPGNVLITEIKEQPPVAILMDFGSARPARKEIRSRSEALQLQEWASEHCSAPYRAPELWDCPSHADIDERTDIWSLGCTLYAVMYGSSPFEYVLTESGGSLQLAIMNAQIKWPSTTKPPYPDSLHQFVIWMLQPQPAVRPNIDNIIIHVDKLMSKYSA